jgi:hypothetical protein
MYRKTGKNRVGSRPQNRYNPFDPQGFTPRIDGAMSTLAVGMSEER